MDISTINLECTGANIVKSGADFHFQQRNSGFPAGGRHGSVRIAGDCSGL